MRLGAGVAVPRGPLLLRGIRRARPDVCLPAVVPGRAPGGRVVDGPSRPRAVAHAERLRRGGKAVVDGRCCRAGGSAEQQPGVGAGLACANVARCFALWSRRCGPGLSRRRWRHSRPSGRGTAP